MNKQDEIRQQIQSNPVVLYMKGTPDFPQCGFSSRVVQILRQCNVNFVSFDVLSDPELRQGIKVFTNWPTIPQLYINAEFIGGSDIVSELFQTGELQKKLQNFLK
jgi:monothiol glutaredoxin